MNNHAVCYVMRHNLALLYTSLIVKAPSNGLKICYIMSSGNVAIYRSLPSGTMHPRVSGLLTSNTLAVIFVTNTMCLGLCSQKVQVQI